MSDDTVGIRELRQNLSKYLQRVVAGETLRVTDRGRAVAVFAPLPGEESALGRLEREHKLVRARLDLTELGVPESPSGASSISDALDETRGEG